jgi:lipopolysaccharide transport system permease protein
VNNQALIKKVYFPRILIPLGAVIEQTVDFGIAFVLLLAMLVYYRIPVSPRILAVPLFATMAALTAFNFGLWLAALNALYRDVRYTVGFIVQLWMFATPVAYSITLVPRQWRTLYALNPMTGVIDGFRWCILGSSSAPGPVILVSVGAVLVILLGGLFYFRRVERSLADVL